MTIFEEHLDLAVRLNQLVLIHTPHLEDKLKGTRMILSALKTVRSWTLAACWWITVRNIPSRW